MNGLAFVARSSPIHGTGLFTVTPVPRRMKLGELSGTVVRVRAIMRAMRARAVIHLVEFGDGWGLECSAGNHFRHLNHSCQANCFLRVVAHRVEIYSRGPIAASCELTVDYRESQHRGGMTCQCGVPGCRSRI